LGKPEFEHFAKVLFVVDDGDARANTCAHGPIFRV
jgi:hypothetical protein